MNDLPQWFDAWGKILAIVLVPAGGFVVALTGYMKEKWAYQVQIKTAENLKVDTARNISGAALGDSMALREIADALRDVADAIRAETKSDEAMARDEMRHTLDRLVSQLPAALKGR